MAVVEDEYTDIPELGDDVLTCKALYQHDWGKNPSPKHIDGMVARMAHVMVCLRCKRCKRERYDYLSSTGHRIGRYYRNPVGYPKMHRYSNEDMWTEMISRSLLVSTYEANGK